MRRSILAEHGQLDLVQKEAEAFCDVAVNPIVTYSGEVTGGETIALSADVYNNVSVEVPIWKYRLHFRRQFLGQTMP